MLKRRGAGRWLMAVGLLVFVGRDGAARPRRRRLPRRRAREGAAPARRQRRGEQLPGQRLEQVPGELPAAVRRRRRPQDGVEPEDRRHRRMAARPHDADGRRQQAADEDPQRLPEDAQAVRGELARQGADGHAAAVEEDGRRHADRHAGLAGDCRRPAGRAARGGRAEGEVGLRRQEVRRPVHLRRAAARHGDVVATTRRSRSSG